VFHVDRLKPVGERDEPFSVSTPLPVPSQDDDTFHVEKIIAYEQRSRGKKYLVKWEGYPDSENLWVWEWALENAQDKIREFMQTNPVEKNPTRKSLRQKRITFVSSL
jgi:hypothetical protein